MNFNAIPLAGFGAPLNLPYGLTVLSAYACGLLTIGSLWNGIKQREKRSEQKMVGWEKEDRKLMAEIASDKEKQLEAKIQTLDVALKTALKKKAELEEKLSGLEKR